MTSRERVLTALNRRCPDRVPVTLYEEVIGYVPALAELFRAKCDGRGAGEYFGCDVTAVEPGPTRLQTSTKIPPAPGVRVDEWGIGWRAGGYLHYEQILHPLQEADAAEIRAYPFPDRGAAYRYSQVYAQVEAAHQRGLAVTGYPGSIFECAWALRGMTELFADISSDWPTAQFLLDGITGCVLQAAQRLAAADIDILILGDDIATQRGLMMSLPLWRRVFKPRLAAIIRAVKEIKPDVLIFYHSDGNVWDAIPDLIEVGVEVLNPVQPECMNPAEVKNAFGARLACFGTVSVQSTMPFGTADQVRAEVRHRIETVGRGGGLLIAPAHVLQPDTPWENMVALFEAVHEYGNYG